jgi:uncharacterized protein (DUF362 family)
MNALNRRLFGATLLARTGALAVQRMRTAGTLTDQRKPRGLESQLRDCKLSFVDLNRDDIRQVELKTPFTGLDSLWAPRTILAADVVVSMPKVKTYHWLGRSA